MKSSMILAASGAVFGLAAVMPRDTYTAVEIVYEYVTVTKGYPAAAATPTSTPAAENYVVYTTVISGGDKPKDPVYETKPSSKEPVYEVKPSSKAAASPTKVQYATPSDAASAGVIHHNYHRANHSSPDIKWSDDLAASAAQCAAQCNMEHNIGYGGGGYGQNLASWGTSESLDGVTDAAAIAAAVSDMWYNGEEPTYEQYFGQNPGGDFHEWGHLTQVVWAGSEEVGCAVARCPKGTMYEGFNAVVIACNYKPAGNIGGAYATNVGKSLGKPSVGSK